MVPCNDSLNNLKDRLLDENDALISRFSLIHNQIEQLKVKDEVLDDDIENIISTLDNRIEDLIQHVTDLNNALVDEC